MLPLIILIELYIELIESYLLDIYSLMLMFDDVRLLQFKQPRGSLKVTSFLEVGFPSRRLEFEADSQVWRG